MAKCTPLLTLDAARSVIREHERGGSYRDCYLNTWVDDQHALLVGTSSHCGGTDKAWLGVVTRDTAAALAAGGVSDWRIKTPRPVDRRVKRSMQREHEGGSAMRCREEPFADGLEPRKTALHEWANAWTKEVAGAVGGLTVGQWHSVRAILHEIRKRAAAGDESHPDDARQNSQQKLDI